jgi:hypothetical protein
LLGLTSEGLVVLYDYIFNKYENLNITRKIYKDKFIYIPDDLYFLDDNYLYYSFYSESIPSFLYFTHFLGAPEPRKWYRFDMETGKKEIIKSPSKFSTIIGRIKNKE